MKAKANIILMTLFISTSLMYLYMLYSVEVDNEVFRNSLKPVPLLLLLLLYVYQSKKVNPSTVVVFVLTILADIITNTLQMFPIGIVIYGVAHLFLVEVVGNNVYKRKTYKKEIVKYFSLGAILFAVIFTYVLSNMGSSYFPIIFYGLTMSLAFSILLINYLGNMRTANALLLAAFGLRVVSDSIYAITIFNESNITFDVISLSIYLTASYLFCRGFILIDESKSDTEESEYENHFLH
ncbi:hypothetical protein EYW44_01975 [Tenacibaculum sp. M341]|nr:hypothetical protein EYW44_01975 [Tenacibaculum sp. M341]